MSEHDASASPSRAHPAPAGPSPASLSPASPAPGSFARFAARAAGTLPAGYAECRALGTGLSPDALATAPEEALWAAHAAAMEALRASVERPGARASAGAGAGAGARPAASGEVDLLWLKHALSERLLGPCRLCWLRCPVDRRAGQTGACGLGAALRPYQDFVHLGEELELIPTHAVFLAGCNYRCTYCSDWAHVVEPERDPEVASAALSRSIDARRRAGAASLSFIGGLPDVNLPGILSALRGATVSVPVVWNSNLSGTPEAMDLLEGVADCVVADLKYGSEACAQEGSAVKGSLAVTHRNLRRVAREGYLVVRHLVLPGHVECCALPALDWLAAELPGVRVNLMDQCQPVPEVRGTAWDRRPSEGELARARCHAEALPLDLVGPGRVAGPPSMDAAARADDPAVCGFESKITIEPDGRVVIENLTPELSALLEALGRPDGDLGAREDAARAWRPEG